MNKPSIVYPILVEGSHDKSKILSIYSGCVFVLNGCNINNSLICFFNTNKIKPIILTDTDKEGKEIRKRLEGVLNEFISLEVSNNDIQTIKKGVAECSITSIKETLDPYCIDNEIEFVSNKDLLLSNKDIDSIKNKYNLPTVSKKEFLLCLTLIKIKYKEFVL